MPKGITEGVTWMKCPKCEGDKIAIVDTIQNEGFTYRRRYCKLCFCTFKTKEEVFAGTLPSKKRLAEPKEKEYQKGFGTSALQQIWR
jgi:transcriptional regulator NrdR family protein